MRDVKKILNDWLSSTAISEEAKKELLSIKDNQDEVEDRFYQDLSFGTGGLRGVIGMGTNRINVYTIGKATQGLANHINKHIKKEDRRVAISYDSRINSDVFAKVAAEVLAANDIEVRIYPRLMPVPSLAFATQELNCCYGIMITASHNPSKYNGYKVYGNDGCQVISEVADSILNEMNALDIFTGVKKMEFNEGLENQKIKYIGDETYTKFIETIKKLSLIKDNEVDKNVKIVYSPLHGTGLKPVTRLLDEMGYKNIIIVKEQEEPDGNFTTCPFPNPEIREAMELGIKYAKKYDADLLFATDPDCDRIGIAVKDHKGEFVLLSGNETGALLLNFICETRIRNQSMPDHPVCVKTIVTTDLISAIAKSYGVECRNVLTGFKYIGEQIALLEKDNRPTDYILGLEESYGYLTGTHVRDKDAVNAALIIVEMFAYYKSHNISLLDVLDDLSKKHGYYSNALKSYMFEGANGMSKMKAIMDQLRNDVNYISGEKILEKIDYSKGINGLPKSNVIKLICSSCSVIFRPSGTEPKLKMYISVIGNTKANNVQKIDEVTRYFDYLINN